MNVAASWWTCVVLLLIPVVCCFNLRHFTNRRPRVFDDEFRPPFAPVRVIELNIPPPTFGSHPLPQQPLLRQERRPPPPPPTPHHHHQQSHHLRPHHEQQDDHQSAGSSRCALLVPAHGTSQYQQTSNAGEEVCITVGAIEEAFKKAVRFYKLKKSDDMESQSLGELGKALTDVTSVISSRYNLSIDIVNNGLPLIDTASTVVGQFCPAFLDGYDRCEVTRYRTINGMCNNLQAPHWGAAHNTFRRLLPPAYGDGVSAMRVSGDGSSLPSARLVSAHLHTDLNRHDHAVTMMLVAWGQVIDHDITFTAELHPEEKDANGRPKMPDCCNDNRLRDEPQCVPINIPRNDAFYSLYGQSCMNMLRSLPGVHHKCKLGPRDPFSTITAYLDASFVYGSDDKTSHRMRTYSGGLLKTMPAFKKFGLKDLLPPNLHAPDEGCIRQKKETFCFDAGDGRVNEQLVLAVIQTLFVREHNRIAEELAKINPHWSDEVIFQETRLIVGAEVQQITYNEFLPMVLGRQEMERHELLLSQEYKYKPDLDATASNEFISAAFRFGHSLLPSTIERWSTTGKYIDARRLSELLRQPYDLYKGGFSDQYAMGLVNQVAQAMDHSVSQEVTNHLFQMPENRFGMDLAAINMQRGRDHGIRGYNDYREYCGLGRVHSFDELRPLMNNNSHAEYERIYRHPDDIDLWSGGLSERSLPGALVGPTLACIIGEQFHKLKFGDRFWFENRGYPSSFTKEQVASIKKVKLSSVFCDNTDNVERVQVYVMVLPDHEVNQLTSCASLPRIDFSLWKDLNGDQTHTANPVYESKSPHQIEFVVPPSLGDRPRSSHPPVYGAAIARSAGTPSSTRSHHSSEQSAPRPSGHSLRQAQQAWWTGPGGREARRLSYNSHDANSQSPQSKLDQSDCCRGTWAPLERP